MSAVDATRLGTFLSAYKVLQKELDRGKWRSLHGVLEDSALIEMRFVKVVVIDTGVDPGSISCQNVAGRSFVSHDERSESPWWLAAHGTQMAKIITTLDPFCQLKVAKVGNFAQDMRVDTVAEVC
jgi:hypothetical protein